MSTYNETITTLMPAKVHTHFRESMKEKHERFGVVTGCDIVELDPMGCDILMATKLFVQQTIRRNCRYMCVCVCACVCV